MIEALLGAFELRTGRYTSPHVQSITERISLDGAPIAAERFVETYQRHQAVRRAWSTPSSPTGSPSSRC